MSRHSLSLYLLHHAAHVWPLWAWSLAQTGDPTRLWQHVLPVQASLGLALVFLVAAAVLCREADRLGLPTAESAMRWLCDS